MLLRLVYVVYGCHVVSFTPNWKNCSSTNPTLIHPLLPTSPSVSTPNTIHDSRLTLWLPDSLGSGPPAYRFYFEYASVIKLVPATSLSRVLQKESSRLRFTIMMVLFRLYVRFHMLTMLYMWALYTLYYVILKTVHPRQLWTGIRWPVPRVCVGPPLVTLSAFCRPHLVLLSWQQYPCIMTFKTTLRPAQWVPLSKYILGALYKYLVTLHYVVHIFKWADWWR